MQVEIRIESPTSLYAYGQVPSAFEVNRVLDVVEGQGGASRFNLTERPLAEPYTKDYDLPGNSPVDWSQRFDMTNWVILSAWSDGSRVGGAVIAMKSPGVDMLEGRNDLAVLWDLRVAPEMRRRRVALSLFTAVESYAIASDCRELKIETQNINVPACRFYASRRCELREVRHGTYPQFPHEIMLLWYKSLATGD
jgi:ribosomal protein S18 acetylase RimI-like enzyme